MAHPAGGRPAHQVGRALAAWVLVAIVIFSLAGRLTEVEHNDAVTWLPKSAEATRAFERAQGAFADSTKLIAVVVYARDTGLTPADQSKVDADRAAFSQYAEGGRLSPSFPARTARRYSSPSRWPGTRKRSRPP